jgi:hypothetical protein
MEVLVGPVGRLALGRLGHGLLFHDRDEQLERPQVEVHGARWYRRAAVS